MTTSELLSGALGTTFYGCVVDSCWLIGGLVGVGLATGGLCDFVCTLGFQLV